MCRCPKRKGGQVYDLFDGFVKIVAFLPYYELLKHVIENGHLKSKTFKYNNLVGVFFVKNYWHTLCFLKY